MSSDIGKRMAHGALWMVAFTFLQRSLGLISTLILVRLLSPTDFGVVAMATSFIVMAQLLAAFSFDLALIQNQEATEEHYHTAWTCNVLLGLLIALAMLGASEAIARFYGHAELVWVVCALALGPLITGFENIGVVAFRKEMQFRREFAFQLSRKLVGFVVVVPLAFFLQSYWALVGGMLAARLAGTGISYLAHPFRPRFSLKKVRGMLRFSRWLLLNNIVGFLKERSSDFVIGRWHGAAPLGVYSVSYEIAIMPTTELAAPINRALLPGFSRIASDPVAMRSTYGTAIGMLALLAVPAAAGIFAVAPFLVPVVLGTKWLAAVPLMEILAPNGGLLLIHSSICTVLIANGHPDRVTKTNALYVVVLLVLLGALAPTFGITGAALAALVTSIIATPLYLVQAKRSVGVEAQVYVRAAFRPLAAALVMAALVRWALPDWSPAMRLAESFGWLVTGILLGAASYATVVSVLWIVAGRPDGAERVLLGRLKQFITKRRASTAP